MKLPNLISAKTAVEVATKAKEARRQSDLEIAANGVKNAAGSGYRQTTIYLNEDLEDSFLAMLHPLGYAVKRDPDELTGPSIIGRIRYLVSW